VLVVLCVWEAVSGYILPHISSHLAILLPSPRSILTTFVQMLTRGEIWLHSLASLKRVLVGFGLAVLIGVPLGIAIGWWSGADKFFSPLVDFLRPIPPMAWIPIGVLWFGIGDPQNIFIILIGAVFPILLNTAAGIRSVGRTLVWAGFTLGGTNNQVLREIAVPSALPMIVTGLRIGLGAGWMALVAAELVAAPAGLGYLIENSRSYLFTEKVIVGMIVIGVLGLLMDGTMRWGANRLQVRLT
jgi:ABC-type nitrate/sulfonate/bicarbonate transport system permease component